MRIKYCCARIHVGLANVVSHFVQPSIEACDVCGFILLLLYSEWCTRVEISRKVKWRTGEEEEVPCTHVVKLAVESWLVNSSDCLFRNMIKETSSGFCRGQ